MKLENNLLKRFEMLLLLLVPTGFIAQPLATETFDRSFLLVEQPATDFSWVRPIGSRWLELPTGPKWVQGKPFSFRPVQEEKSRKISVKTLAVLPNQNKRKRST